MKTATVLFLCSLASPGGVKNKENEKYIYIALKTGETYVEFWDLRFQKILRVNLVQLSNQSA